MSSPWVTLVGLTTPQGHPVETDRVEVRDAVTKEPLPRNTLGQVALRTTETHRGWVVWFFVQNLIKRVARGEAMVPIDRVVPQAQASTDERLKPTTTIRPSAERRPSRRGPMSSVSPEALAEAQVLANDGVSLRKLSERFKVSKDALVRAGLKTLHQRRPGRPSISPQLIDQVEVLRGFGSSVKQAAGGLGLSERTIQRHTSK